MRKTRPGRVPPIPRGGGVHTAGEVLRPPPAASQRPALYPGRASTYPGVTLTRCHRRFTHVHPSGLPLTCRPRMEQGPLRLLPRGFAPRRYQRRTPGWGRAIEHLPGLRHQRHRRPPTQRATCACDLVSHHLEGAFLPGSHQVLTTMIVLRRQALSSSHTPPEPTTSSPTRGFRSDGYRRDLVVCRPPDVERGAHKGEVRGSGMSERSSAAEDRHSVQIAEPSRGVVEAENVRCDRYDGSLGGLGRVSCQGGQSPQQTGRCSCPTGSAADPSSCPPS